MSWAMYEPMDSVHTKEVLQMPGIHEKPSMQHKSDYVTQTPVQLQPMPHQMPSQKVTANNTKNVNIPEGTPAKTTWLDISDYHDLNDWGFLVVAAHRLTASPTRISALPIENSWPSQVSSS